jgi:Tfp pilus assembly protein PilN
MIKINLVPAELLAKARQKQQLMQAAAGGVVVACFVALLSMAHYWSLARVDRQLAYDQAELKKLQTIVNQVEELEKTAAAVRSRLNVINDLLKGRALYPRFMADFVRSVPLGVHIKGLSTTGGGSNAAPVKLSVNGEARSPQDVADWSRKMSESGYFSNIELGSISAAATAGYTFSLTSIYTPHL